MSHTQIGGTFTRSGTTTAAQVLDEAKYFAVSILNGSLDQIDDAQELLKNYHPNNFYPKLVDYAAPAAVSFTPAPTITPVDLVEPDEPNTDLAFQDISPLEIGLLPEFTVAAPTFTLPVRPNQVAEFTDAAPTIVTDFVFPDAPLELSAPIPSAPTLGERVAPVAPSVNLPDFSGAVPTFSGVAPTNLAATFGTAYRDAAPNTIAFVNGYVDAELAKLNPRFHEQMAVVETQLAKYLDGGTGLNAAAENAIYERARGKNSAEALRVRDAAYGEAAGRGFTLPNGALMASIQQARQAGSDNNAAAAREIVAMQAEMEQKNLQFAVTTSAALRSTILNATLNYMQSLVGINGQALDYAKTLLGATTEMYNIEVKKFSVQLDAWRAEVALYETKLKGVLARIELYKGEISALEALTTVDRLRVDTFRARIDALGSLANVYKTRIEAVGARAGLEKLKLDLYSTRVQAHGNLVQAKNSEWQGYSAEIAGQSAQAGLFREQVGAYTAQLAGVRARIDAQAEVIKAQVETNKAHADQVKSATEVFTSVVRARSDIATSRIDLQKLGLGAYSEQLKAEIASAQWAMDRFKTIAMTSIDMEKTRADIYKIVTDVNLTKLKAMADVGVAGAGIQGNLAGAAMSGINSLAVLTETV